MICRAATALQPDVTGAVVDTFLQYGPIGIICLVLGWFAWRAIRREEVRADTAESEKRDLQREYRDAVSTLERDFRERVIPLVVEANRTLQEVGMVLRRERERG